MATNAVNGVVTQLNWNSNRAHKIRLLAFDCAQPTLMVCLLDAHSDHAQNIRETPFETTPAISTGTYFDTFGNSVRRFVAPPGDLTVCRDAIMEDNGLPDPVKFDAEEIAVERLPNDTLIFMFGSRYCETDKLSDIAWQLFGSSPRGWRRIRSAISSATI